MGFGNRIRILRIQKGLSQKQLATLANISASYLCDMEKNRINGSINVLEKLAMSLDVTLVDLLKP